MSNLAVSRSPGGVFYQSPGHVRGRDSGSIFVYTFALQLPRYACTSYNGSTWSVSDNAAPWKDRVADGVVVYDGKIWVCGGATSVTERYNDVWYSPDGLSSWTEATSSAPWAARYGHACANFGGKMWVIGGNIVTAYKNDVWHSTDGVTWTEATSSAGWSARDFHSCLVYDDKIWVIGGHSSSPLNLFDAWYSTNGTSWTQTTSTGPWTGLVRACAHNGAIWAIDGGGVWNSTDGETWTEITTIVPWFAPRDRVWSFKGKIFTTYNGGVSYSTNGIDWTSVWNVWGAGAPSMPVVFPEAT